MSIMNLFSSAPRQAAEPQQQQPQQQPRTQETPEEPAFQQSTNADPKAINQNSGEDPTSGIDQFNDLFTMPEGEEAAQEAIPGDYFNYDPEKLKTSVSNMNFTDSQQFQELSERALQGDTQAFGQVINAVAQTVYSKSVEVATAIANKAAAGSYEHSMKDLPGRVRSNLADNSLQGINPKYQSPALRPMVEAARTQFEKKYPNATSAEIANLTNQYLAEAGKIFGEPTQDPTQRPTQEPAAPKDENWDSFFGIPATMSQ